MNYSKIIRLLRNETDYKERAKLVEKLGSVKNLRALKPLLKGLCVPNTYVQEIVEKILLEFGDSVVGELILLLDNEDADFRAGAARILGKMQCSKAIEYLINLLNDKDFGVRIWAVKALGDIRNPVALGPLIELLGKIDKNDFSLRSSTVKAIGKIGGSKAVSPLMEALNDKFDWVRTEAAKALGNIKDPKAIDPLINALQKIRSSSIASSDIISIINALGKFKDKKAINPLMDKLKNRNPLVRFQAAKTLGDIGDESLVPVLKKLYLKEKSRNIKTDIGRAISMIDDQRHLYARYEKNALASEKSKKNIIELGDGEEVEYVYGQPVPARLREGIIKVVKENPGILQKDLDMPALGASLEREGYIKREKSGNTFKLFPRDDHYSGQDLELMSFFGKSIDIQIRSYSDSKEQILKYFGNETLKTLFKHTWDEYTMWKDYTKQFSKSDEEWGKDVEIENIHERKPGVYLYSRSEDDDILNGFLHKIGACIKFDINECLKRIIEKYWTEDCKNELEKFLSKYGFFADEAFVIYKLEDILGSEKNKKLNAELAKNADSIKIKWLGLQGARMRSDSILHLYIKHQKFKLGMKPELYFKECVYCGEKFYPYYYAGMFYRNFGQILKCFPADMSSKEINFCSDHFPTLTYGTFLEDEVYDRPKIKEKMANLLKELADILEFIPPSTFHENLNYLVDISKEKFDKAIKTVSSMPPFEKNIATQPKGYKDIFESWLKALDAAGVIEGGVIKTQRGYICEAKDGHYCRSIGEKVIDDFLYKHNIPHEREPHYPGERKYRADWKVGSNFIEFWGLQGDEDYDGKTEQKKAIAREHNIPLIEITFSDLRKLDNKLIQLEE